MQTRLFDQPPELDLDRDPYREKRSASNHLAAEFRIGEDEAFGLVLGYGSESAARKALLQRWWRGEVELREEAA
jgi:hypothetical protein